MSMPIDIPRRNKKTPSPPPNPRNLPEGLHSLRHHITIPNTPIYRFSEWMNSPSREETTTSSATTSNPQQPPQSLKTPRRKSSTPAYKWNHFNILEELTEMEKHGPIKTTEETGKKTEVEGAEEQTTAEEVEQDNTKVKGEEGKVARVSNQMD